MESIVTKVHFDEGIISSLNLGEFKSVLVLAGTQNSLRIWETRVKPILEDQKVKFEVFTNITANLTDTEVYSVVEYAKDLDVDCILSVGADAVMDCGRLASLLLSHGGFLHDYLPRGAVGPNGITEKMIHHITVPTMPSAGSEIANHASFRQGGHIKTIQSMYLVPVATFVDPRIMLGMPGEMWAVRGFDAFATALAAFVSEKANETSDAYALSALESYIKHCVNLPKKPDNIEDIKHACAASMNAYLAASYSCIELYSAVANAIVARLSIRRGVAMAMVTGEISAFLYKENPKKFDTVAKMLGGKGGAANVRSFINKLVKDLKIQMPDKLVSSADIKTILGRVSE
ncbi:MAG: iron-containing alcohol dehydrogenase [Firmicutes bacterium]|nr:iron-containing alcohol dehydrogenase [Bacillota bacterium]